MSKPYPDPLYICLKIGEDLKRLSDFLTTRDPRDVKRIKRAGNDNTFRIGRGNASDTTSRLPNYEELSVSGDRARTEPVTRRHVTAAVAVVLLLAVAGVASALPECLPRCSGADLSGALLYGAELSGARLNGADLRGALLYGAADLTDATLDGADLRGAVLNDADLRGTRLVGADLRGAALIEADLSGAILAGADLRGVNLAGADLRGALLDGADLRGALLDDADLRGAFLKEADLRGVLGCDLHAVLPGC